LMVMTGSLPVEVLPDKKGPTALAGHHPQARMSFRPLKKG